jgi:hypothetical protein
MNMQEREIDYRPLTANATLRRAAKFKVTYPKMPPAAWLGAALFVLAIGYILTRNVLAGVIIFVVVAALGYWIRLKDKQKEVKFRDFAAANGFEYISGGAPGVETGSIFGFGAARFAKRIVSGNYNGFPFWFGQYRYSTGVLANSRTVRQGVMSIQLGRQFSHILIDGGMHALSGAKAADTFIELDGVDPSVTDIYRVYHQEGQEQDVRSIVTPDLLYTMRNKVQRRVDVEIKGDRMYIYTGLFLEPTEKDVRTLLTILGSLG